jgi:hypothetical protein
MFFTNKKFEQKPAPPLMNISLFNNVNTKVSLEPNRKSQNKHDFKINMLQRIENTMGCIYCK